MPEAYSSMTVPRSVLCTYCCEKPWECILFADKPHTLVGHNPVRLCVNQCFISSFETRFLPYAHSCTVLSEFLQSLFAADNNVGRRKTSHTVQSWSVSTILTRYTCLACTCPDNSQKA